jgi:rhodanese-related sulfurtransferase
MLIALLSFGYMASAEVVDLSHSEFDKKLNDNPELVIIDVRSAKEFASGHVPSAINIPHKAILQTPSLLDTYLDQELVFYCHSGRRAKTIIDTLQSRRDTDGQTIYHLQGDIVGWIEANKPLEK